MTETMPSLQPIPDADKRRRYAELERQLARIVDARSTASHEVRMVKTRAVEEAMWVPFRAAMKAFEAPYESRIEAIEAEFDAKAAALEAEMESLGLGDRQYDDDYSVAEICTLTGLPVFEDDEIIRDAESGDVILRAALPWPETTP